GLLAPQMLGDEHEDRVADRFLGRVTEQALGGLVPAGYDRVQNLGDDGIVGRFHDGGQTGLGIGGDDLAFRHMSSGSVVSCRTSSSSGAGSRPDDPKRPAKAYSSRMLQS